jgi:ACS family hexuronate transporter-like MFS transporter
MAGSKNPNRNVEKGSGWLVVCATSFTMLAVNWSWYSYPLLVPTLMENMQLSYVEASLPMSLLTIGYMLLQIPSGVLADKYGAKLPIIFGTIICSAASLVCGFAASSSYLFFGRLFLGMGSGLCFIPAASFVTATTPLRIRGKAVGVYGASAAIGGIAAFVTTPLIEAVYGWRGAFLLPGLIVFIASLLFWILPIRSHYASLQEDLAQETSVQLGTALLGREIWMLNYLALTMLGVSTAVSTWTPTYLIETYDLEKHVRGFSCAYFK